MVKDNFTLTEDMMFGEAQIVAIIAYVIMFITGLTTNTMSLLHLLRERLRGKDRSKMTLLLIHLSVADLTVYLVYKRFIRYDLSLKEISIFLFSEKCTYFIKLLIT